ncbi:hypothetical protein D3C85_1328290 [compost metagenome]
MSLYASITETVRSAFGILLILKYSSPRSVSTALTCPKARSARKALISGELPRLWPTLDPSRLLYRIVPPRLTISIFPRPLILRLLNLSVKKLLSTVVAKTPMILPLLSLMGLEKASSIFLLLLEVMASEI